MKIINDMIVPKYTKSYATQENLIKAVKKVLAQLEILETGADLIIVTKENRLFPVIKLASSHHHYAFDIASNHFIVIA